MSQVQVRRAGDRFVTRAEGRTTRHSFSFDRHYDPANVELGFLVCHNEDLVDPGHGYPAHPHRDLEILTWVLSGSLRHRDSTGAGGLVVPGLVQRLSAGSGVVHTESHGGGPGADQPVHFVQMWARPDVPGLPPEYEQGDVTEALDAGDWVTLAAGLPSYADVAAVRLRTGRAALHAARLSAGEAVHAPESPATHLFVARGTVEVDGVGPVGAGDALRAFGASGLRLTADDQGAELLAWEMHPKPW